MDESVRYKVLFFFTLITLNTASAEAGEIRLRPECRCAGTIVLLGDVAQINDKDPARAKSLSSVSLFPAPTGTRIVTRQEIMTRVALQVSDLSGMTFVGPRQVKLYHGSSDVVPARRTTAAERNTATRRIKTAILRRVEEAGDQGQFLQVACELDDDQVRLIAAADHELVIDGGKAPWPGTQKFNVQVAVAGRPRRVEVQANLAVQRAALFVVRPIRRGELMKPDHVELRPVPTNANVDDLVYHVDDVVGKEATRQMAPGVILSKAAVRAPRLVQRGDLVEVVAVASGVRVRTKGIALDEGSRGQLVIVQSPDRKKKYSARVVDFRRVEIYAGPVKVGP